MPNTSRPTAGGLPAFGTTGTIVGKTSAAAPRARTPTASTRLQDEQRRDPLRAAQAGNGGEREQPDADGDRERRRPGR